MNSLRAGDQYLDERAEGVKEIINELVQSILIEQAGREVFQREETIVLLISNYTGQEGWREFVQVENELHTIPLFQKSLIIRSLIIKFELFELLQQVIQILQLQENRETGLKSLVEHVHKLGINDSGFVEMLHKSQFQLIFSSHPLGLVRTSHLKLLKQTSIILEKLLTQEFSLFEREREISKLHALLVLIWNSEETFSDHFEGNELQRIKYTQFFFKETMISTVTNFYTSLTNLVSAKLASGYGEGRKKTFSLPLFLTLGYLVGSNISTDRLLPSDHPIKIILLQKRLILKDYIQEITQLLSIFSVNSHYMKVTRDLDLSIEQDKTEFQEFTFSTQGLNIDEPYRQKLDFIRLKLENTLNYTGHIAEELGLERTKIGYNPLKIVRLGGKYYKNSKEFLKDLKLINHSLKINKGKSLSNEYILPLMNKVRVFGFHLASLNILINSKFVTSTFDDIATHLYPNKDSQSQIFVESELRSVRPLGIDSLMSRNVLKRDSIDLLALLLSIRSCATYLSSSSVNSIVLTNLKSESSIFKLLLLLKEIGLIEVQDERVSRVDVGIIISIDTPELLYSSGTFISNLFENQTYKEFIKRGGGIQEVMFDYTELSKTIGLLKTSVESYKFQQSLSLIGQKHGVRFRFFHGRGGAISRGGIPSNFAIRSLPLGSSRLLKFLEQGELFESKFLKGELAFQDLEDVFHGIIVKRLDDKLMKGKSGELSEKKLEKLEYLAEVVNGKYNDLLATDGFFEFFAQITPIELLNKFFINEESKELPRDVGELNQTNGKLWMTAWNHNRLMIPIYFGLGTAIEKFTRKYGKGELQNLYNSSRIFATYIDHVNMVLTKVNLKVAQQYLLQAKDTQNSRRFYKEITTEFHLIQKSFQSLRINSLTEPTIQKQINERNSLVEPLELIFTHMFKLWRTDSTVDPHEKSLIELDLQRLLRVIMNGLRNTG